MGIIKNIKDSLTERSVKIKLADGSIESFKNGSLVEGTITGSKVTGMLLFSSKSEKSFYFLQSSHDGSGVPTETLKKVFGESINPFSRSWVFRINDDKSLTDEVVITKKIKELKYPIYTLSIKNDYEKLTVKAGVMKSLKSKVDFISLFKVKNHPDCCGVKIGYNFSNFEEFTKEEYEIALHAFKTIRLFKVPIIVHLAEYQYKAIKFLNELDSAREISRYLNRNSDNEITVYEISPLKEE